MENPEIVELVKGAVAEAIAPLNLEIETLKSANEESAKEIETLKTANEESAKSIKDLKKALSAVKNAPVVEEEIVENTFDEKWADRSFTHEKVTYKFRFPSCHVGDRVLTPGEVVEDEDIQAELVKLFTEGQTSFIKTDK